MNAEEILAKAESESPQGWVIFPLLRGKVLSGILGWLFGIIMGVGLLALIVPAVIPYNYLQGTGSVILTSLLLGVLLFMAGGSLSLLIKDIFRLVHADEHLIVITSEDFVKLDGKKIIHVPLAEIRHVTPRGRAPMERTVDAASTDLRQIPGLGENLMGFIAGRGFSASGMSWRRKRMRTPTSLAFIDSRTESEVTVVNDDAHGDPFLIAAVLKKCSAAVQEAAV